MTTDHDHTAEFTPAEVTELKALAKPSTAEALHRAAQFVQDYAAWERLAGSIGRFGKWVIVLVALVAATKAGLLGFLGIG